jgi:surface protein
VDTSQAGTSASDQFTLPLTTGTYDLEIDWGDGGIIENYIGTSAITHTFPIAGIYTVSIKKNTWSGSIIFNNGGDRRKLISITQFSTQITFNNTVGMFYGCSNLNISSKVGMKFSSNDLTRIFRNCTSLNIEDFNSWDTSIVTNMTSVFHGCTNFNGSIDQWDMSSVTSMNQMFTDARNFNGLIGGWNTSSLIAMPQMFLGAINFNQPIGGWNTSNVTNMTGVFTNATSFDQPIGTWNTSSVTNMAGLFRGATSFDQPIGTWNITSVTSMSIMFTGVTLSTVNYDSLLIGWESQNVKNNVSLDGGNSKYTLGTPAEAARQRLITDHNWTIVDGGGI